ncbi:hypothetical protein CO676_31070 [Sinorhizobium sp. BJ1]|nr:hypothetical protein CO676_31070 [Sinorhizobium sp. BJ1]
MAGQLIQLAILGRHADGDRAARLAAFSICFARSGRERKLRAAGAPSRLRDRPGAGAGTNLSFFVRTQACRRKPFIKA